MEKLLYKAGTAVATASLVLGSIVPFALAQSTTVEVSGNGAGSENEAEVEVNNTTTVTQTNYANITNDVDVEGETGSNNANYNTGGDVSVNTGNATANVDVSNTANANIAEVNGCCPGDVNVLVSENGANSENEAEVEFNNTTTVDQDNTAYIKNEVEVDLDTGDNNANYNTGGQVTIGTGNADGTVWISNTANKNVALVGSGQNNGGSVWVEISGNGYNSDNDADVEVTSNKTINQTNYANILNDVDVDLDTGENNANYNTGGDVSIDTGNADAHVDISNLANFNWADVEGCGCILDLTVKVKNNGADSENEAEVELNSTVFVDQDNTFDCNKDKKDKKDEECNDVEVDLDTGDNNANYNTQGGEPAITTGNAEGNVSVDTTVNKNVVGDVGDIEFPEFDSSSSFSALFVLLLALFSS